MFTAALCVIAFCWLSCLYNKIQSDKHPWETLLTGGSNLSPASYTFLPPWTGFELAILAVGFIGFVLMLTFED